ncbi:hypothetical protein B0H12DRAFT_1234598 [Mycena haematopus]|nr:hypothetical protein B0H12DRAFT_1234598 [Mycena haematopus]
MLFRSLGDLYNLVCVISLAQILLGVWTMYSFGYKETVQSQLILVVAGLYMLPLMYILKRYQHHADHYLSRVYNHVKFLAYMLVLTLFFDIVSGFFFFVGPSKTVLASCGADNWLPSLRCSPPVLVIILPLVNCAIFLCAARRIWLRARSIYGEEMVPLPPPPPPPVQLVPAWALGSIPEVEAGFSEAQSIAI